MVVRVYVSGISGNKEVKKRQQRVTMILDSKNIQYNIIDIAEPGNESEKEFMQEHSKLKDTKHPLPPQIFNDDHYCGDYEEFDMANELDELEKFLNLSGDNVNKNSTENGISNGSNVVIEKEELFKEDIRESTEEALGSVSNTDPEAVSIGNEVVSSVPDEIPQNVPSAPDETAQTCDEIPSNQDHDLPKDLVEHESLNEEKNGDVNIEEDEEAADITAHEE